MAAQEYRYDTEVVRLFYDYTSSVVWFPYPIGYDESGLSAALVADLKAWGLLHDEGLDSEQMWRSPELAAQAARECEQLAHRLGDELGSTFEIEFSVFTPPKRIYRSAEAPTNPAAAAVFAAWADAARAENARLARAAAERRGGEIRGRWFAVMPDGTRFKPIDPPPQK